MSEYADRDIEGQGQEYVKHVSAMTAEGLHSKSDIAAELAHRDIVIQQLESDKAELLEFVKWVMDDKGSELSDLSFQLGMDLLNKRRS